MYYKSKYVILLVIQIVLATIMAESEKLVTVQQSTNDNDLIENSKAKYSFEKIKEEILQVVKLATNDIFEELKLIKDEMKIIIQTGNISTLTTKLETLATKDSVEKMKSDVSTELASIKQLVNKTMCTENQEAFGSLLGEKLAILPSKDDLQSIKSITENYSNMLKYDISKLKENVLNSSNLLNNIDYSVTALNYSMGNNGVLLGSLSNIVKEDHKTVKSIASKLDQTVSNIATGVDEIQLQMQNLGTKDYIKQLYIKLEQISTTEVQLLRDLQTLVDKFMNSTNTDIQLSEKHSMDKITNLVKESDNKIASLIESFKEICRLFNTSKQSISQIEDHLESFKHIYEKSLNLTSSMSYTVNITHTLLSNIESVVKYINTNTLLIPNVVMQRLGYLSFDVKKLLKETEKISIEKIVEQVSKNTDNIDSNGMTLPQDLQMNISDALNKLLITNNMSSVLAKLNDLAKETKNDTTMVDLGITSLNSAFDDLMFRLVSFEMTVDNIQSDINEMKGTITINNNQNDRFETFDTTINSVNRTLSTFVSALQSFDIGLNSCTNNISLVKKQLEEVHYGTDLTVDESEFVNTSIYKVDIKISEVADLINSMESKLDTLEDEVAKENKDFTHVDETVNLINEKLEVLDKMSKMDTNVYEELEVMQSSILALEENAKSVKSSTSGIKDGISDIQGSIQLMNYTMQNLQKTASNINSTTNTIQLYTDPCKPPYMLLGDQCIAVFEIKKTWKDAKDHCSNLGAQFLEIKRESMGPITSHLHHRYTGNYHVWIGASDLKTEGTFRWTSGKNVDLSWGWGRGQPNNWKDGEDCVELCSVHDDLMNDMDCNELYYFACEKH